MHCKDGSLTDLYCKTAPPLASSTHLPSDVFMAFDAFALILAMLALGMLFARFDVLPASAAEVLNRVVLLVCLPAAVLVHVPSLQFDPALVGLAATPWLLTLATVLLVWPLARLLRFRRDETAVVLLCVALCNSSFIG